MIARFVKKAARMSDCTSESSVMFKVGQNCIYTPYMTVYLVISLPKIPCICNVYLWFWPTLVMLCYKFRVAKKNRSPGHGLLKPVQLYACNGNDNSVKGKWSHFGITFIIKLLDDKDTSTKA